MRGDHARRAAVFAVAVLAVAGVATADALVTATTSAAQPTPASAVVSGEAARSSAWYCAGVASPPSGIQPSLLVTNFGRRTVSGTIDTVPVGTSIAAASTFTAAPGQQMSVPVVAGADSVMLDGGDVGVDQQLSGAAGISTAPCSSTASSSWYFAKGSTASGDSLQVALYNPMPTPAVVDVTFVSASAGLEVPPAYQGISVPPGTVLVENAGDHVSGDPNLATEVSVLSGQVVASETVQSGSPSPTGGLSLVDGVSSPLRQWAFAQNADIAGGGNVFDILNPSSSPATVTVAPAFVHDQAAPLSLRVGPQSLVTFVAQNQTRIPGGVLFGLTFATTKDRGIVVARQASGSGAPPAIATTEAQPGGVENWLVPGVPPGESPWGMSLLDLAGHPVRVTVLQVAAGGRTNPLGGESDVQLVPRVLYTMSSASVPVGSVPIVVRASGPVAVELDAAPAQPPGVETVPAWPLLSPAS